MVSRVIACCDLDLWLLTFWTQNLISTSANLHASVTKIGWNWHLPWHRGHQNVMLNVNGTFRCGRCFSILYVDFNCSRAWQNCIHLCDTFMTLFDSSVVAEVVNSSSCCLLCGAYWLVTRQLASSNGTIKRPAVTVCDSLWQPFSRLQAPFAAFCAGAEPASFCSATSGQFVR